jgi:hypothetical protein
MAAVRGEVSWLRRNPLAAGEFAGWGRNQFSQVDWSSLARAKRLRWRLVLAGLFLRAAVFLQVLQRVNNALRSAPCNSLEVLLVAVASCPELAGGGQQLAVMPGRGSNAEETHKRVSLNPSVLGNT